MQKKKTRTSKTKKTATKTNKKTKTKKLTQSDLKKIKGGRVMAGWNCCSFPNR